MSLGSAAHSKAVTISSHLAPPLASLPEDKITSSIALCELAISPASTDEISTEAVEGGFTTTPVEGSRKGAVTPVAVKENTAAPVVKPSEPISYAGLLKVSASLEELGTPVEHDSVVPFVLIPDENIVSAKEEFRDFIYARFHGDWPSMGCIIGVINAIWAKTGPRIFVHNVGNGEFLLKVTNAKTKEQLLARTCWNIAGYPMFVAPWSPEFTPEEGPITSAVVPVELRGVPYLIFNRESLSRLATAVGKPDSLAPETERKENFQVAKLYVRVDLTRELPSKIISGFSSGKEVEISVSYPWLPLKCESCGKDREVTKRNKPRTGRARRNPPINTIHAENSVGKEGEKESTTDEQTLEEDEIPAEGLSTGDDVGDSPAGTSVGQDSVAGNGCSDRAVGTEPDVRSFQGS
ncbi:hypothetical protein F2Q70_00040383 [Brassica cretica]|uniref:DUF4283 domain-containing protein n=1 Tax=Brassica cretica TaxID=69181 RepID=A0A8S9K678_BRACR|nr:hypothetical protein F2Q70_00040383 [Brassica cretica]